MRLLSEIKKPWALALVLACLAFVLRAPLVGLNEFHMDEGLYASISSSIIDRDPLLQRGHPIDKPPLLFYAGSLIHFLAPGEAGFRLVSVLASALSVGLMVLLCARYAGGTAAAVTGLLMAASPLDRAFGSAFFMDPLFTAMLILALYGLMEEDFALAGLAFGLACATKQTGFFYLPVFIVFFWAVGASRKACIKAGVALVVTLGFLLFWSGIFAKPRWGMFALMAASQPEVGLLRGSLVENVAAWANRFWGFFGSASMVWMGLVLGIVYSFLGIFQRAIDGPSRGVALKLASGLGIFSLVLMIAWNFRKYDRYLVAMVPFVALSFGLAGGFLVECLKEKSERLATILSLSLMAACLWFPLH
jgi:4-amino-4-deoxy-L-arabinose transferase-like glycosyltransferase